MKGAFAQEKVNPPPAADVAPAAAPADDAKDHRMFGVLPNYKTVNDPSQPVTPIGPRQKFALVLHYFDPFTYGFTAVQSALQQYSNSPEGYGQGLEGYAKRYGANFTDAFTNELFTVGVFPTLLHEDPRYFRKGSGGVGHRTFYAVSRVFVARTDSGTQRFNFSEILGNVSSGAVSTVYYPRDERSIGGVLSRAGFQIGYDAMFNALKEFYPDIKRKLSKKSH